MRLGAKDSNLYRLIQSQLSCHWTSPHRPCRACTRMAHGGISSGRILPRTDDIRLGFFLPFLFDDQTFLL